MARADTGHPQGEATPRKQPWDDSSLFLRMWHAPPPLLFHVKVSLQAETQKGTCRVVVPRL